MGLFAETVAASTAKGLWDVTSWRSLSPPRPSRWLAGYLQLTERAIPVLNHTDNERPPKSLTALESTRASFFELTDNDTRLAPLRCRLGARPH